MKVKLDEVRVESFATTAGNDGARGTVNAHEATPRFSCQPYYTCPECASPVMEERPIDD
ncbi:MAG TPA: pinensin family lanthipeptide [Longimicrobium sp.]|nr:pinensin family lanthipeptide [Longimicrobium sp.]